MEMPLVRAVGMDGYRLVEAKKPEYRKVDDGRCRRKEGTMAKRRL
jgi:hypothetical protein